MFIGEDGGTECNRTCGQVEQMHKRFELCDMRRESWQWVFRVIVGNTLNIPAKVHYRQDIRR